MKWFVQRTVFRGGPHYNEDAFHRAMERGVQTGDVVWDVGANVGKYSQQFAEWAGPTGSVVAFEPSPECLSALQTLATSNPTLKVLAIALSDTDGAAKFDTSRGGTSVQNQLDADGDMQVRVARADSLVIEGELPAPTAVKIDVEGYEPEVLDGFEGIIATSPRVLFIEVHFEALARRHEAAFPAALAKRLQKSGYTCDWVDPSHLVAERLTERPIAS